jgi:protein N-terminal amidase
MHLSRHHCYVKVPHQLHKFYPTPHKSSKSASKDSELTNSIGYNFRSLHHITPYLEHTTSGISSLWARTTALKYECVVTVGYPEKVDMTDRWPASPEYYNSAITVNAKGETIANYRKSFLYYHDETWALEGPDGFFNGVIPRLGNVAMGICK